MANDWKHNLPMILTYARAAAAPEATIETASDRLLAEAARAPRAPPLPPQAEARLADIGRA